MRSVLIALIFIFLSSFYDVTSFRGDNASSEKFQPQKQKESFINIKSTELLNSITYTWDSKLIGNKLWFVGDHLIQSFNVETSQIITNKVNASYNKIHFFKDNIWFFTHQSEGNDIDNNAIPLIRYSLISQKYIKYTEKDLNLGSNLSIYDDGNTAWVGGGSRVISINLNNNSIKNVANFKSQITDINGNESFVWFGTENNGVIQYDKTNKTFLSYNVDSTALKDNSITDETYANKRLIVNSGTGLSVFDTVNNRWDNYENELKGYNGYYWVDKLHTIWTTVNLDSGDQKLKYLNLNHSSWESIPLPQDVIVNDIESINNRVVLLCTNQGVLQLIKSTGETKSVLHNDGIDQIHYINNKEFIAISSNRIYKLELN